MAQHLAVGVYGNLGDAEAAVRSMGSGLPFALLGGAEPGMVGPMPSVAGWLFQLGLTTEDVTKYDGALKDGKFLVIVHGSIASAIKGRDVLAKLKSEQLTLHAPAMS